jgi:hypothetical protein
MCVELKRESAYQGVGARKNKLSTEVLNCSLTNPVNRVPSVEYRRITKSKGRRRDDLLTLTQSPFYIPTSGSEVTPPIAIARQLCPFSPSVWSLIKVRAGTVCRCPAFKSNGLWYSNSNGITIIVCFLDLTCLTLSNFR